MQGVAGRQTRYVNKLEDRSRSLWEGRFKSSIISTKEYLPACCRYIELNPLQAGLVADPRQYKWSSYNRKTKGAKDPVVDLPGGYRALGATAAKRRKTYAEYVLGTVPENELKIIREALQRGQMTGGDRFCQEISEKLRVHLSNRGPGRPKRQIK